MYVPASLLRIIKPLLIPIISQALGAFAVTLPICRGSCSCYCRPQPLEPLLGPVAGHAVHDPRMHGMQYRQEEAQQHVEEHGGEATWNHALDSPVVELQA
jgi:hypothetical protein